MKIQNVTSTAAGATTANVLSGSAFEFVKRKSLVRIKVVGDAAGEQRVTMQSGSQVLLEESSISRQNRFPTADDDAVEDIAMPGDRLVLKVRNTGAGANNLFWSVEILPIA